MGAKFHTNPASADKEVFLENDLPRGELSGSRWSLFCPWGRDGWDQIFYLYYRAGAGRKSSAWLMVALEGSFL